MAALAIRSIAPSPEGVDYMSQQSRTSEVDHWNEVERQARQGARLFWLNHPRVAYHYYRKALIDGLTWRQWIPRALGKPASCALELGCGNGEALRATWQAGTARSLTGLDLDDSRFAEMRREMEEAGVAVQFQAADVNSLRLPPNSFNLIYAVQSFHHFENLEHICAQVSQALTPGGYFVLDEFVGPARFQWTDAQLALTAQLLGLLSRQLRIYQNGIEKLHEGRSTPEEVIRVCPSEAIRSNEIPAVFRKYFNVVHERALGGTIQHLLYSGIIHNFPDGDPATDHMIDCINGLEEVFIGYGILPSDFMLLVGRKR
jgi:SAM-dependent methyltransferase